MSREANMVFSEPSLSLRSKVVNSNPNNIRAEIREGVIGSIARTI
jgi:hypothetical protein